MPPIDEQLSETEKYWKIPKKLALILSPVIVAVLIKCNFTRAVRDSIKEAAHGKCAECGTYVGVDKLIAAHTFHYHDRQQIPEYNTPHNGRALCLRCETEYHIRHIHCPATIGMKDEATNADAVWSNYFSLPRRDQLTLKNRYLRLLMSITRYLRDGTVW